jgi:Spy/CpxP family protein refolding chaperone
MSRITKMAAFSMALLAGPAAAATGAGPYAGQEQREIKALSANEIQDYLAGKGMGLAKAAELNHYPGPAHVLELAVKLGLSDEQVTHTRNIFTAMQKDAMRHGRALVDKERELDRLFASGAIDPDKLRATLADIARLQAELRRVHLQAHLDQRLVLTDEQVRRYDTLRGYGSSAGGHSHGEHAH